MPARTLLSSEQRTRLFSIPTDPPEMVRHYTLGADDLALVRTKRRPVNRVGFAVQLCLLRYPGFGLGPGEQPSEAVIAFVAHQLGAPPADFSDYAQRDQTRREHVVELQRYLCLRSFGLADWRACLRVGSEAAWATDRGEPIVLTILAHLRANRVVLPSATVLERIGLAARARARKKTFETLAAGMSDTERNTLAGLLTVDPELRRSRFAWLRDYSESPAPSNIAALLDRLEYARGLGVDPARAGRIHTARLARLIDEGAIMTVPHIAELEPVRRTAILVVQTASLETRLTDATLAMFEKYMGTLFSRARNRDERRYQATRRDVARALVLFRRTIAALRHAKEAGEDGVAVVEREIGMAQLDGVLPVIAAAADVADQDILVTAAERYSVLRRFSPRFLAAFDFRSNTPNDPVLAALELLRAMDRDGARVLPKRPPSSFLPPQWRKLIFANGAADRRLYETAVLATRCRSAGSDSHCRVNRKTSGESLPAQWRLHLRVASDLPAGLSFTARNPSRSRVGPGFQVAASSGRMAASATTSQSRSGCAGRPLGFCSAKGSPLTCAAWKAGAIFGVPPRILVLPWDSDDAGSEVEGRPERKSGQPSIAFP
jgi:hypothetical protein